MAQALPSSTAHGAFAPAVSWPAIFAGAAGAAALSLILLVLGTGLGLASASPWVVGRPDEGPFGTAAVVWICFTQVIASGMGGYLAGRLRTRWADTPRDEVYFRDTAHGFLAWAVASLATAALLTTVIGTILGADMREASSAAAVAADNSEQAHRALWLFVSLLMGAFFASLAATFGGRQRDTD
ncbi:MAG: hypothetical protein GTN84_14220 [Hydrogenophaga sp.]|uniref:hypothetical protein n=1 Tax=Hydrogenophaga sp. TaxID=1904254 RepID=UPI0016B762A8|nr:hypothetical protein [Hydrogenophaga sp.]NIM40191.1 hypothetical protein [Hydrogenophaga sp.]NIN25425.1 hypothetical protein [Hydrogenophaga sp.]NIN32282.1 hypothetical protein [Hydrogenophaga sp.]NIN56531.1 hypothetical protein [Hydrogenophaga sp.]NIO52840.1 hypothetical protein [Hydrogenophaga sp.]